MPARNQPARATNTVLPRFQTDPSICRVGDYYLACSSFRSPIRRPRMSRCPSAVTATAMRTGRSATCPSLTVTFTQPMKTTGTGEPTRLITVFRPRGSDYANAWATSIWSVRDAGGKVRAIAGYHTAPSLETLCDTVIDAMLPGRRTGDAALLFARMHAPDPHRRRLGRRARPRAGAAPRKFAVDKPEKRSRSAGSHQRASKRFTRQLELPRIPC